MLKWISDDDGRWILIHTPDGACGIFVQDNDPGEQGGPSSVWVDEANDRVGVRNDSNTEWDFFSTGGGGGTNFIVAPDGDFIVDDSGNRIVATTPTGSERLFVDTATMTWDFSTPGQVKGVVI